MSIAQLTIRNEQDAWDLLHQVLDNGAPEGLFEVVFKDWPVLEIKLNGEKFHSSLTAKLMEGFIDLQKNLYRAYAQYYYKKSSSLYLTDLDKKSLDIIFKVSDGSSDVKADCVRALDSFVKGVTTKMNGTQSLLAILGVSLMIAGSTCFYFYIDSQAKIKSLEQTTLLSKEESHRMEIFAKALEKEPSLTYVVSDVENSYDGIIRGATEAESLIVGRHTIPKDLALGLLKKTRTKSTQTQINGIYKVNEVNNSLERAFKVEVSNGEDRFQATLSESVITAGSSKDILQKALFDRKPVFLYINANLLRGDISKAVIVGVEEIKEEE